MDNPAILKRKRPLSDTECSCDLTKSRCYHRHWTRVRECNILISRYWGKPSEVGTAGTAIDFSSTETVSALCYLGLLRNTNSLLVLQDHERLLSRVLLAEVHQRCGVVVTGQPGSGKSTFGLVLLLHRLAKSKPTLFTSIDGTTYLFEANGVYTCPSTVNMHAIGGIPPTTSSDRLWSIIDSDRASDESPSWLLRTGCIFSICTPPLNQENYQGFIKCDWPMVLYSNDMTDEECFAILKDWKRLAPALVENFLIDKRTRYNAAMKDIESLSQVRREITPFPRDLALYLLDGDEFAVNVESALLSINADHLNSHLYNRFLRPDMLPHHLFRVHSLPSQKPMGSDQFYFDFLSSQTREQVTQAWADMHFDDLRWLVLACNLSPYLSVFLGWVFETYVIRILSMEIPTAPSMLLDFQDMIAGEKLMFHFDARQDGLRELYVHDTGIVSCRPITHSQTRVPTAHSTTPPISFPSISRREIVRFDRTSDDIVKFNPAMIFVPNQRNFPLFDAIMFETTPGNVTAWILQMTLSFRHGGSEEGIVALQNIQKKADAEGMKLTFCYVLLVPNRDGTVAAPEHHIVWKMPEGWDTVRGRTFVQYIKVH